MVARMLCVSTTSYESHTTAHLVPMDGDGKVLLSGELFLNFEEKDPMYQAGKIYLIHVEPS